MLQQQSPSIDIYYGSTGQKVYLGSFDSDSTFEFSSDSLQSTNNQQSIRNALSYRFPQKFLNPTYDNLYIPCTPAIEISEIQKQKISHPFLSNNKSLLKINPLNQDLCVQGFQSGRRSALIKFEDDCFYRLKGCGNLCEGFPIQKGVTEDPESYEVRGCSFYHTAKRELFINAKVENILNGHNLKAGNSSIGYWQYAQNIDELVQSQYEIKIENKCPEVPKYCTIFKTLGDKRLGTHLLQGLSLLNLYFLSLCKDLNNIDQVFKCFQILSDQTFNCQTKAD